MSSDDHGSLRVLIVEDDEHYLALLEEMFEQNPDYAAAVQTATTLADAVAAIGRNEPDAVLLDLGLPDSQGLRTVKGVLEASNEEALAVVVLTASGDASMASEALRSGIQDYLVKDDLTRELCTRVVRHGVLRARLVAELNEARAGERRERELRRLQQLADAGDTSLSTESPGADPLARRAGDRYEQELVGEYERILRSAVEERPYGPNDGIDQDVRSLANVLGFLRAGPRDVIELHTRCLRSLTERLDPDRASVVVEEGRILVLQLMGRLVAHYRDRGETGTTAREDDT